MSLPLTIRKNIKDSEPKIAASLEKLNTEAGLGEWEFECDYAALHALIKAKNSTSSYIERVGELVYWYVNGFVNGLVSFCKISPLHKEAVIESVKSRKIVFRAVPDPFKSVGGYPYLSAYVHADVENEQFIISAPVNHLGSNVDGSSQSLETAFDQPGVIPLKTRHNIAASQSKVDEALEKIKQATGFDWEFDCDYAQLLKLYNAKHPTGDYGRRLGDALTWYLNPLASTIVEFCKNPLQKEALLEGAASHKITFNLVPTPFKTAPTKSYAWGSYSRTYAEGGVLSMQVPVDNFCSNVDGVGDSLKVCFDDPKNPMTLLARKNIAEFNEKKENFIERIKAKTGVEYEIEADYVAILADWTNFDKNLTSETSNRIGEIILNWYLGALTGNIERLCRDDMGKEAFVEATPKKVIRFKTCSTLKKGESPFYNRSRLEDGALVCEIYINNIQSNPGMAGEDIEKLL